ncbi:vacuolar protein sorting-associated protein vta1 [Holotrichia oblita]|uniref:Vacuolar protein sorting-associated protein vta1 n=1 Tax=Holotrichia oblita TaxID=644536 RepID=A0ACB9TEG5_HOLOL|nr:vacuolar protein sorting-associated protein vta1 [Holotrichia oblita]
MGFPPVPHDIKAISHFLKVADEHDQRNVTVSYWCRMYAVQSAMKIIPGPKSQEVSQLLIAIMDWLERTKIEKKMNREYLNVVAVETYLLNFSTKLFNKASSQDGAPHYRPNMVKSFYTSGILFDILDQFGTLSEDIEEKRKYAKWRAAYIHNCLKKGVMPTPGSTVVLNDKEDEYTDFLPKSELDKIKGKTPEDEDIPSQPVMPPTPLPTFPTDQSRYVPVTPPSNTTNVTLSPEQMEKAQKYCKYANSALNYDDVKTAIDNLQKALHLLQFGQEM